MLLLNSTCFYSYSVFCTLCEWPSRCAVGLHTTNVTFPVCWKRYCLIRALFIQTQFWVAFFFCGCRGVTSRKKPSQLIAGDLRELSLLYSNSKHEFNYLFVCNVACTTCLFRPLPDLPRNHISKGMGWGREVNGWTDRQTDKQTDRQTGRQTDRKTDRYTHTDTHTTAWQHESLLGAKKEKENRNIKWISHWKKKNVSQWFVRIIGPD